MVSGYIHRSNKNFPSKNINNNTLKKMALLEVKDYTDHKHMYICLYVCVCARESYNVLFFSPLLWAGILHSIFQFM